MFKLSFGTAVHHGGTKFTEEISFGLSGVPDNPKTLARSYSLLSVLCVSVVTIFF